MNEFRPAAGSAAPRVRIPSLFEIFFGKLASWIRQLAQWRKQGLLKRALQARRRHAVRLETLEPRLLLSTDIAYASGILDPALNLALSFTEDGGSDVVRLTNLDDGTFTEHALDADNVINVNITGGQLQDTLIIDFGFAGTLDSPTRPQLNVVFDGIDEALPSDLTAINDLLRIQNSGGMFTLAGLDINSTEAVEIAGDVTVEGLLDIAVVATDAAQYATDLGALGVPV
jgi:hypothetical protein